MALVVPLVVVGQGGNVDKVVDMDMPQEADPLSADSLVLRAGMGGVVDYSYHYDTTPILLPS